MSLAYIDPRGAYLAVSEINLDSVDAARSFNGDVFAADIAVILEIFRNASEIVAGELAFGAVFIEGTHFNICFA